MSVAEKLRELAQAETPRSQELRDAADAFDLAAYAVGAPCKNWPDPEMEKAFNAANRDARRLYLEVTGEVFFPQREAVKF